MTQEELPLDPDEFGELIDASKPCSSGTCVSGDSIDVSSNQTIELKDASSSSGEIRVDLTLQSEPGSSLSSRDLSVFTTSCRTRAPSSVSTAGESVDHNMKETPVPAVVDLTLSESVHVADAVEEDFMDDLNDEDFCTSFVNFDDDSGDEKCDLSNYDAQEYVPCEEGGSDSLDEDTESSDCEEWKGEGVEYVKTVAEMAEEANTSDLFDPKVLGKLYNYKIMHF